MKKCIEHGKELKGPNRANNYWHVVDFNKQEYHSISKEEYDAIEDAVAPPNQPIESHFSNIPPRDYDAENRGKVRHGLLAAKIQFEGLKLLTEQDLAILEGYVNWVMGDDPKVDKDFP